MKPGRMIRKPGNRLFTTEPAMGGQPGPQAGKLRPGESAAAGGQRLNRFLAQAGLASRREVEDTIGSGQVTVNGRVVTSPAFRLDPERDAVKVAGRRVWAQPLVYVLMNKPEGVITTAEDPERRATVVGLLQGVRARVVPVGRLDANTSGALLLTNDGELTLRLTHPRYEFAKTYEAKVSGLPTEGGLRKLARGVSIPAASGRFEKTLPARVRLLQAWERNALVEITLKEGRYHQVRKMLAAIGHPVIRLCRVKYGFLTTAGLPLGRWRYLRPEEVKHLHAAVGL